MQAAVLSSTIESVHVHRDGAIVTRVIEAPALSEARTSRVIGLPILLDDASVRLSVEGSAVAIDLRVALEATSVTDDEPDDRERARLAAEVARLENLLLHVDRLRAMVERTSVYRRPQPQDATPPIEVDVAARLTLLDFRVSEMDRLATERAGVARDLDRAKEDLAVFLDRLARRRGDRAPRPDELRKSAVFTLRPTGAEPAPLRLALSYAVAGARWAPTYALHVDSKNGRARLDVRASISQTTDEDWRDVALVVSSAPLVRPCDLPELTSLRIGRAQPRPKRGWRPAPGDVGVLFEDYRRALRSAPPSAPLPPAARSAPAETGALSEPAHDGPTPVSLQSPEAFAAMAPAMAMPAAAFGGAPGNAPPPRAAPMSMSAAMPMGAAPPPPMPARSSAPLAKARGLRQQSDADALLQEAPPIVEIEPDDRLLSFGSLRLPAPARSSGTLTIAKRDEVYLEASATLDVRLAAKVSVALSAAESKQRAAIGQRPWPQRHRPPSTTEGFDAVYEASARVDIPADGDFHSVPLLSAESPCTLSFVAVPRETSDVFRRAEITSPLEVPLLPGPCDVYTDGSYLLATDVEVVAPHARVSLGLGVDQAIKIARNVWHAEQTAGLMGGSLVLKHHIKIDVVSHKAHPVSIEIRERVPVAAENEEDVRVEIADVKPPWVVWEPPASEPELKGGHAWRVRLEPSQKAELEASYTIRIPAKLELVGGNRRD
ncbi:MAG: mucoidy inhibitor MuiA family protein [Myxococcales bacterium]|nr:mucoidy inhibitor MuiA family protein [Myxococcales bacterium]